jgi:hypothetical protein
MPGIGTSIASKLIAEIGDIRRFSNADKLARFAAVAPEVISENPDGTQKIKFITQFDDGNLSKIKISTVFPNSWTDDAIIQGIEDVGNTAPIGVRVSDGATLHRDIVNEVQIEVIKIGDKVTSGYPTGGVNSGLLPNFQAPQ